MHKCAWVLKLGATCIVSTTGACILWPDNWFAWLIWMTTFMIWSMYCNQQKCAAAFFLFHSTGLVHMFSNRVVCGTEDWKTGDADGPPATCPTNRPVPLYFFLILRNHWQPGILTFYKLKNKNLSMFQKKNNQIKNMMTFSKVVIKHSSIQWIFSKHIKNKKTITFHTTTHQQWIPQQLPSYKQ